MPMSISPSIGGPRNLKYAPVSPLAHPVGLLPPELRVHDPLRVGGGSAVAVPRALGGVQRRRVARHRGRAIVREII